MFDIDLVVPFVDNTDPVWQHVFAQACNLPEQHIKREIASSPRYFNSGLFAYNYRCFKKFMPWIRTIHLIVSNPEQVPPEIRDDEKLHIVLHKDIIPAQFLPTFNSCTIEMFISNIPGLTEHFIYANDDMYPISDLKPSDFFTRDGQPKLKIIQRKTPEKPTEFDVVCMNCEKVVSEYYGKPLTHHAYYQYPEHTIHP